MRSKCRCSYVLQFAFRHAVSCVLHRPPSQVIHCTVLFHNKVQLTKKWPKSTTDISGDSSSRGGRARKTRRRAKSFERLNLTQSTRPPAERLAGRTKWSRALAPRTASGQRQTSRWPRDKSPETGVFAKLEASKKPLMILPQVHLRKPCYDFYFL